MHVQKHVFLDLQTHAKPSSKFHSSNWTSEGTERQRKILRGTSMFRNYFPGAWKTSLECTFGIFWTANNWWPGKQVVLSWFWSDWSDFGFFEYRRIKTFEPVHFQCNLPKSTHFFTSSRVVYEKNHGKYNFLVFLQKHMVHARELFEICSELRWWMVLLQSTPQNPRLPTTQTYFFTYLGLISPVEFWFFKKCEKL